MDASHPRRGKIARLSAIANEVRVFAEREAERSGLPGGDQGPADADRHLVGVAELSRRAGPLLAAAMAETNEWGSTEAMLREILTGRPVSPSNTPAARGMDRRNNLLAVGVGARASSVEDVVLRARSLMERAIQVYGGSGANNTPVWRPVRHWSDQGSLSDWSPEKWSRVDEAAHLAQYREGMARSGAPERESTATGDLVAVRAHLRDGHRVSGHLRSSP